MATEQAKYPPPRRRIQPVPIQSFSSNAAFAAPINNTEPGPSSAEKGARPPGRRMRFKIPPGDRLDTIIIDYKQVGTLALRLFEQQLFQFNIFEHPVDSVDKRGPENTKRNKGRTY
jgi:hypothetical protein